MFRHFKDGEKQNLPEAEEMTQEDANAESQVSDAVEDSQVSDAVEERQVSEKPAEIQTSDADTSFTEKLLGELSCTLCYELFAEPTTLTCGHTFCMHCMRKSLAYKNHCPICRKIISQSLKPNSVIKSICNQFFPEEYKSRLESLVAEEDTGAQLSRLPLFVLEPLLPRQSMRLHVFEPRYRNLVSYCLSNDMRFGMIGPHTMFGVEVVITQYNPAYDGTSHIVIQARKRFELQDRSIHEQGYPEGLATDVEEIPGGTPEELSEIREAITVEMTAWLKACKYRRGETRVNSMLAQLGQAPEDMEEFSLWVVAALNPYPYMGVCREIRVQALAMKNTKERLEFVLKTMKDSTRMLNQRFFYFRQSGMGCLMLIGLISLIMYLLEN